MIDGMFDRSIDAYQKAMDLSYKRNEAITSNIANAETPQYRAVDVNFAGELERAFQKHGSQNSDVLLTDDRHMNTLAASGQAFLTPDYSGVTKADGNNVDIDVQVGKMAFNSGRYTFAAGTVRKKFQMIRNAIQQAYR